VGKLILVRHGESEWNAKGLWTGWTDIPLSEKGKKEAEAIAEAIHTIPIDICYTSTLSRAKETLTIILQFLGKNPPVIENKALNERNYGDYTGKNKWDIKKKLGDEDFAKLRRSWNYPVPNGETLKDVAARVYPFFKEVILPELLQGKNVLVAAHGNSIRALMKEIENIPDESIAFIEIATGEAVIYNFDNKGLIASENRIKAKTAY
jgi:2,3-bisphosphoglycerate-dependent phosphoglycerate mutase